MGFPIMFTGFRNHVDADEFGRLPEAIIHIIQSFLTSKEAAQTTLLSKSWRTAWLTRPNLDFNMRDFERSEDDEYYYYDVGPRPIFLEFAEKTLERYENLNLKIESFRLNTIIPGCWRSAPDVKLVHGALKLGPTRLVFECEDPYDFHVPNEVFRYDNLLSLAAVSCGIDLDTNREVCCSRLQFLSFENVVMKSLDKLFHIISSCPLIEKLKLCHLHVDGDGDGHGHGLQTIYLHRLTSLVLKDVTFDTEFLADLSSKFPSLKDLTLYVYQCRGEILISSPTLERLHLNMGRHNHQSSGKVRLDVPSIRKLKFESSFNIPKLSVESNSRGWESYVHVYVWERLSASLFYRLSSFIKKLIRLSRISLSLHVHSSGNIDYEGRDIRGLPTPEIENLNIIYHQELASLSCYALFDGLFRMCHPKVITQCRSTDGLRLHFRETNNIHFLVKRFLDARDAKVPIPNHFMYGLNDLNEARAQVFDQAVSTWRDVTLESLLQDSTIVKDYQDIRFQLNWKN